MRRKPRPKNMKVLAKIQHRTGTVTWRHFCYAPVKVVLRWEMESQQRASVAIARWAQDDFGLRLENWEDVDLLKALIQQRYHERYPEIVNEPSFMDRYGCCRAWMVEKMKGE